MFQTDYYYKVNNVVNKFQKCWWRRLFLGQKLIEGLIGILIEYCELAILASEQRLQNARLKAALHSVIQPIQLVGDAEDWVNAAETQRTYTWAEFQELDQLIKELK